MWTLEKSVTWKVQKNAQTRRRYQFWHFHQHTPEKSRRTRRTNEKKVISHLFCWRLYTLYIYKWVEVLQIKTPRLVLSNYLPFAFFYRYHYHHLTLCVVIWYFLSHARSTKHFNCKSVEVICISWPTTRHCCHFIAIGVVVFIVIIIVIIVSHLAWHTHTIFNEFPRKPTLYYPHTRLCAKSACRLFKNSDFSPIWCALNLVNYSRSTNPEPPQNGCLTVVCRGKFASAKE